MLNIETYGMIIYGGGTTVLFLIISILAHKKLNDENPSTSIFKKISLPHGTVILSEQGVHKPMTNTIKHHHSTATPSLNNHNTFFSFNTYSQQPIHNTPDEHSPTVSIFSTKFWSNPDHKMLTQSFNTSILQLTNENDEQNQDYYKLPKSSNSFIYPSNSSNHNLTPQLFIPKVHPNTIQQQRYTPLSNQGIHLERRCTYCSSIMQYFKDLIRNRSIYNPSLQHAWDVATDIAVLFKWGRHALHGIDIDHIDFVPLFLTALLVQLGYRLVSCYAVYQSEKSITRAMLQCVDLLMLREIYVSHIECRCTDTLIYIKKLEAVLEAAPQLILTTYFFLRVGTLEKSQTEIIGWLWSFFTLSTKVINDDSKMYKHIKNRWNRQFMYRFLFRLFEICSRVLILGLIAIAVSARAAMVVVVIDLSLLVFSYYYGLLSNDIMNVLGSLITFVDLTIYPKVPPLFWWYMTTQSIQRVRKPMYKDVISDESRHNSVEITSENHIHCERKSMNIFDIGIFNKKNDKIQSVSSSNKSNKTNLTSDNSTEVKEEEKVEHSRDQLIRSLKISMDEIRRDSQVYPPSHIALKLATNIEGQKSVRERSSVLLKELASIEAVYLEIQSEKRMNAKYIEYKCCGCCCWCKMCGGLLPQFVIRNCVNKCYSMVLCLSWVYCTYTICNKKKSSTQMRNTSNILDEIETEDAKFSELKDDEHITKKPKKRSEQKNRTQKTKQVDTDIDEKYQVSRSEDSVPSCNAVDVITDTLSVLKMVDFAQQKTFEDDASSSEEPPEEWWKAGSGTKFAVSTLKSLHSLHSFPDLPDGLTPLAENKADVVHPMNTLRDLTIREGSDEEASFPWTQTPENKEEETKDTSSYTDTDHSYSAPGHQTVKNDNKPSIQLVANAINVAHISRLATITPRKQWHIKPNINDVEFVSDSEWSASLHTSSDTDTNDEDTIKTETVSNDIKESLPISTRLAVYLGNIPKVSLISDESKEGNKTPNLAIQLSNMAHLNALIPDNEMRYDTSMPSSSTATPVLPNEDHRLALLTMAGADSYQAERLQTFFTKYANHDPSALNTPVQTLAYSSTNSLSGFPDIVTLPQNQDDLLKLTPSPPKLSFKSSGTSDECVIQIVHSNEDNTTPFNIGIDINMSCDTLHAHDTPHFSHHTPKTKQLDIRACCGLNKCLFDREIVHRYAFLVILARTMQSCLFLPFIVYIVYINPSLLGGKQDVAESRVYSLSCAPWCTSQDSRISLSHSVVFMQYLSICGLCATMGILFFLLSSPYLMLATSITRSAMSLLKTGCIYDSIQYFSKEAKCIPLEMLKDFNFMQMFFDEIIKHRIPIFYDDEILNNADSEILLRALQLNIAAQLAEHVAITTVKEGYLHLLQFIVYCASMDNYIFDPSNCVDEDGNGLLAVAVIGGDEHIIKYILNISGYDLRKNMNNEDVIDLLILHGDIHTLRLMILFFETEHLLDLLKKTFFRSIKKGNMEFINVMESLSYDTKQWIINYMDRDRMNKTLLMCTAMNGHANTTEWLLNIVKVDPTKQDINGKTALMYACIKQNVNVVDIFVKHRTIDGYINSQCNNGITALLYATMEGSLDCICTLMQKMNILDTNIGGGIHEETALVHAARYGHQEIAVQLIKAKDIDVNVSDNKGKTAMMFGSRYGLTKIVKALLRHDDIKVKMRDSDGKCALDHVEENIYLGDINHEIIKKAIKAYILSKERAQNVDPQKLAQKRRSFIMIGELAALQTSNKIQQRYSKTNRSLSKVHKKKKKKRRKSVLEMTPSTKRNSKRPLVDIVIDDIEFYLWYSIQMDYDMVCHWFLENTRCDRDLIGRENMEMINIALVGNNAFHFAVKCGSDLCLRVLLEIDGTDKRESFVNERDKDGYTPFHLAVIDGKITIVDLLLNYSETEINCVDEDHTTPLMHAAMRGYANIVHLLLNHKRFDDADYINYHDKKGQTALFLAVRYNRARVVQLLINHKYIEIDKARNNGITPLMYAAKYGEYTIIELLLSTKNIDINKKDYINGNTVHFYVEQCKDNKIKHEIASRLKFYNIWKLAQNNNDISVAVSYDDDVDFYTLATKTLEIKKVENDWNAELMEIDIEDKLFNKWRSEVQILGICAERQDDIVFAVLWNHWMVKSESDNDEHFQSLKWYYFLVIISQKGWHRLFIRFIEEIQYSEIKINWRFIPNDIREIDLMVKHEHIDEIQEYVKQMNGKINKISAIKHMKLILESVFENFGQSAANKTKLAQCLRFVLSKTMEQYIFNHECC